MTRVVGSSPRSSTAAITGHRAPHPFLVDRIFEIVDPADMVDRRMVRPGRRIELDRQRHPLRRIEIVEPFRDRERRMRAGVGHEQHPGFVLLRPFPVQPVDGMLRDIAVVVLIVRLADAGAAVHLARAGTRRHAVFGRAQEADQRPLPLHDMHRDDLFGEAVIILAGAEMQLADRRHRRAAVAHPVMPGRIAPVIGERVVPIAGLMRVAPGRQRRPRRAAQRAAAIGVVEAHAALRDAVENRCLHDRVSVGADEIARVVVGQEEDQVRGFGHFKTSGAYSSTRRGK